MSRFDQFLNRYGTLIPASVWHQIVENTGKDPRFLKELICGCQELQNGLLDKINREQASNHHPDTLVVALTGGIGVGKSTVVDTFEGLGAHVIDVDHLSHQCMMEGLPLYDEMVEYFGKRILDSFGYINRSSVAQIVFNSIPDMDRLNDMSHPHVIREMAKQIGSALGHHKVIVVDIPLFFESNLHRQTKIPFDKIVVVTAPHEIRCERLAMRSGLSKEDAVKRMSFQWRDEQRLLFADYVIANDGTFEEAEEKAREVWEKLNK